MNIDILANILNFSGYEAVDALLFSPYKNDIMELMRVRSFRLAYEIKKFKAVPYVKYIDYGLKYNYEALTYKANGMLNYRIIADTARSTFNMMALTFKAKWDLAYMTTLNHDEAAQYGTLCSGDLTNEQYKAIKITGINYMTKLMDEIDNEHLNLVENNRRKFKMINIICQAVNIDVMIDDHKMCKVTPPGGNYKVAMYGRHTVYKSPVKLLIYIKKQEETPIFFN